MLKHKSHRGELLQLNWRSSLDINSRILVGTGALSKIADVLAQIEAGNKVLLLKQAKLFIKETNQIKESLHNQNTSVHVLDLPDGEECKSIQQLTKIWQVLYDLKFTRKDTILAFGGGAVTDVAGFASSTYLRGINLISVPTTLLAQVDAAIGGKTGVNLNKGKNLVGGFYFAKAVLVDAALLATLPEEQFQSGLAEVIKYALLEKTIADETEYEIGQKLLLPILESCVEDLDWKHELLPGILTASIKMKLAVVGKDPQESGLRRCLNLGHTLGHALESLSEFSLSHGQAVAIGTVFACCLSVQKKAIPETERKRVVALLEKAGLPVKIPAGMSLPYLLDYLFRDKKREGEAIKMILPKGELGVVNYNELLGRQELEKNLNSFVG